MHTSSVRPDELRRCARCGQAALVCARDWQHRVLGVATGTWTRELECRSCGAKVTLYSPKHIAVERVFAFVMLPAIFPGLYFLASARRKARAWSDNPVVGGASTSPPRGPGDRVCAGCRGRARCTAMHRRQMWGRDVGTRCRYACSRCAKVFTVHDGRGVAFSLAVASLLTVMAALVVAIPPGSDVGAEASNRWFGVGLSVIAALGWIALALQLRARRVHPMA
jgi:hypothetical protein